MATSILDKADFRTRKITRDKGVQKNTFFKIS